MFRSGRVTYALDVYSFGVLLACLFCGQSPYHGITPFQARAGRAGGRAGGRGFRIGERRHTARVPCSAGQAYCSRGGSSRRRSPAAALPELIPVWCWVARVGVQALQAKLQEELPLLAGSMPEACRRLVRDCTRAQRHER